MSNSEIDALAKLAYSGHVLVPEVLQSSISDYYSALITVLVALLGIFSLLGYFFIKGAAKKDIEDQLDKTLNSLEDKYLKKISDQVREELENDYITYDELDNVKREILTEVEIYYENSNYRTDVVVYKEPWWE